MTTSPSTPPLQRYSRPQRSAHWWTAALMVLTYASIESHGFLQRGSFARLTVVQLHYWLGIAVLAITLPRIARRLREGAPPIEPPPGAAARLSAGAMHLALFIFLVVQPLLGIATRLVSGHGIGVPFTDRAVPSIMADRALSKAIEGVHEQIGTVFYAVIGLHIAAALWHWARRRDNVMQRML
ncbi:MAG: cytochrome b [Proteobacteria bacterium]|nr:cytochrome b [Pseudomonadota bacterium]